MYSPTQRTRIGQPLRVLEVKDEKLKRVSKVRKVFLTEKDQPMDNGVVSLSDLKDCYWIFLFVYFVFFLTYIK